ncbi:Signal transduction histidine kinase [Devosia crocina]|uniref:histidine kinase n=1 Tax=Devosia crocina TaxID=429728 RepID=A0A1I7NRR9_9HYPH|nr:HAMP domain-containing sensor histidine kinase [Devosia crocina]SFV37310.1 Signal transduction histidine kinase [Devosia crocina]
MDQLLDPSAAAPATGGPAAKPLRHRNWLGLPSLRLTTLLPMALSGVVFVVTLTIAWLAADLANRQNTASLADKAQVFLDASAGHFPQGEALTETGVRDALRSALAVRTILGEEALAAGWFDNGVFTAMVVPEDAAERLEPHLAQALERGRGSPFDLSDDSRGVLTRVYGEAGAPMAISGIFDTTELSQANEAVHQAALLLSLLLALATASAAYVLGRVAISPLVAFAGRLAEGGTDSAKLLASQYLTSEIIELETILALRREDEKTREAMAQRLAQLERDQVLARLAATLAHEVRNPLSGIRNAFSTLRRFGDDKAVREETLDIIEGGLASLQRLTDVTLSTYRRRSGDGVITAADIKDLALIISPQAKEKHLELLWEIPDTITILADTDAVRQMLVNLLLNACKASPDGGQIRVSATREPDGVRMRISDRGAGLPEGVRRHIQAGLSADASSTRELGLWVVHSLADELGASVALESRVGEGTTVTVLFPAEGGKARGGEPDAR